MISLGLVAKLPSINTDTHPLKSSSCETKGYPLSTIDLQIEAKVFFRSVGHPM